MSNFLAPGKVADNIANLFPAPVTTPEQHRQDQLGIMSHLSGEAKYIAGTKLKEAQPISIYILAT